MNDKSQIAAPLLPNGYLNAWWLAARPRTLPVSFGPIIVGTALAKGEGITINWLLALSALLFSLWIQIGTNLINDALDYKKGADSGHRLGPQRMTQGGYLSFKEVMIGGWLCFTLAVICGVPLLVAGGWPLALIFCLSVACGYLYTGGPFPLAYSGWSDLFVLIFFGWVSTCTVYYLQAGTVSLFCFLAATQIGLLAIVPHAINHLRDRQSDQQVNKKTIAVRWGSLVARWEITSLSFFPFILGLIWWPLAGQAMMTLLPWISLFWIARNVQAIWITEPGPVYNQFLATSAKCQLAFSCLLALGSLLSQ